MIYGIPCYPNANAWNHLILHVQRTSDNHLLFKSITLNSQTSTLNRYDSPIPTTWYGITINYHLASPPKAPRVQSVAEV